MTETAATVKIDEISQVVRKLQFEVPWVEVRQQLDASYAKISKSAKVKGFRPGKIPRAVLETYYKEQAEEETVYALVNKCYFDLIKKHGVDAINEPRIEQEGIKENSNFTFTATVEVPPVIEPVGYDGMTVTKNFREVKDEDVENVLKKLRQSLATFRDVGEERGVAKNDFITLDYQGIIDGIPVENLKGVDSPIQLSGSSLFPGFEDQLLGLKKGEEKEFTITTPPDFPLAEFADKEVLFKVKIKEIREQILPEINEDFVKNFEQFSSLPELLDNIRNSLKAEYENEANADYENAVIDELLKMNSFEVPPSIVERQIYAMMEDNARYLVSRGMPKEQAIKSSMSLYDSLKPKAERIVKSFYLIDAIQSKESITVSDAEIDDYIKTLAAKRNEEFDVLKKRFTDSNIREDIRRQLSHQKVFKFIEERSLNREGQKPAEGEGEQQ